MTIKKLKQNYTEHHTSLTRGYISTKSEGEILPYSGRFGKGYKVLTHNPQSTLYCYVTYWVE